MNPAEAWRDKGSYFSWSPRREDAPEVQIFHVELGDVGAPPLVLVHGFPTSSVDFVEVAERLSDRYRVCAMDFPGFGFSHKPLGWGLAPPHRRRPDARGALAASIAVVGATSVQRPAARRGRVAVDGSCELNAGSET